MPTQPTIPFSPLDRLALEGEARRPKPTLSPALASLLKSQRPVDPEWRPAETPDLFETRRRVSRKTQAPS